MTTPLFGGNLASCRALMALHPDAVPGPRDRPVPFAAGTPPARTPARIWSAAALAAIALAGGLAATSPVA